MPTGSGKTFTAVKWLMENVINRGQCVLWIAHRHELLRQVQEAFLSAASLADKKRLRIRIVSGEYCSATQIDPADDILICSVNNLAQRRDIAERHVCDPRRFLVIDEAHHAPAKSYRDMIKLLNGKGKVLGLTATPTRTEESERSTLSQLFGNSIIHQVSIRPLIEQGFLARPIPVSVRTNADAEAGVTPEDLACLERFNELSEKWRERIAHLTERNRVIVEHYLTNRERYGRTLIFAINVDHAVLLKGAFVEAKVQAEYVASYRPDATDTEDRTAEIIGRFRDPDGDLDVLINVQMLTEGVDIPNIQTVFLTRPTRSETLLRQMIGRGLRGPSAGGTKEAFLVSFQDDWGRFKDFESPFDLVSDIVDAAEPEQRETIQTRVLEGLPWDLVQTVSAEYRKNAVHSPIEVFEAVPHGWYVLEGVDGDDAVRQIIPTYSHQMTCWEALIERLSAMSPKQLRAVVTETLCHEYFEDCDSPRPGEYQVGMVLDLYRRGDRPPTHSDFIERQLSDPAVIAKDILERNLGERDKNQLIDERHANPLAKAIYPYLPEFYLAVQQACFELSHPNEARRPVRGIPIFEPLADQQLMAVPHHDLDDIMQTVLKRATDILQLTPPFSAQVEWTRRIIKGWYAMAYYRDVPGGDKIRVNRLLNSPDISRTTMEFLLWHEYLHLYLRKGHTRIFREQERAWPGCVEAERELDTLNEKFGIQYW